MPRQPKSELAAGAFFIVSIRRLFPRFPDDIKNLSKYSGIFKTNS